MGIQEIGRSIVWGYFAISGVGLIFSRIELRF